MNADWSKPRKIFHFDNAYLQKEKQGELEFIASKITIIQQSVTSFLKGEENHLAKILPLNRALQSVLIRNDYSLVHQSLIKQFYSVYKSFLDQASKQPNTLLYLLACFMDKKETYRILFTILNNYLSPHQQNHKLSIEEQAYDILCKQIINSAHVEKIGHELMALVEVYRTTNNQEQLVEIQQQLKLASQLGIYSYFDHEFLQRSKIFFVKSSHSISRNEEIFSMIDQSLRRQILLNKILKPSQNTVCYLQKEYIEEYFPFLIQYMDYLIQENKFSRLQILWKFTTKLGQEEKSLFQSRLKQIVKDVRLFLTEGQNVSGILLFRDKLLYVIDSCFASNRTLHNMLFNTIEEVLLSNENTYNQALADKIFKDDQKESDQLIQQLFKLIPNKERFVKQLEVRFFRWIIYSSVQNVYYQEGIIHMMKKECGSALCKKLDRMVSDVWREGRMVYYHDQSGIFKCRLLSLNDWPKFSFTNIVLPDKMKETIEQFQTQFKRHPEHAYKQLTWVNELGTLQLSINGVNSFFSEVEAALIFILDKSFRPMNAQQLSEILQGKCEQIAQILTLLYQNGILEYNQHNKTYDINDANTKSYATLKKQKSSITESKEIQIKDNSIIIDAFIVKILKRKKTLHKTEISQMVLQQMGKMKPKIEEINASIERLEKRQFLDIDKSKGILHYKQ